MIQLKLLSAAVFAAAVIAAPAMAREHHVTRQSADAAYAGAYAAADPAPYAAAPDAAYAASGYGAYAYRCVPAPRVGQFAGGPWTNDVPCQPYTGAAY
jgi:hypothetical protein